MHSSCLNKWTRKWICKWQKARNHQITIKEYEKWVKTSSLQLNSTTKGSRELFKLFWHKFQSHYLKIMSKRCFGKIFTDLYLKKNLKEEKLMSLLLTWNLITFLKKTPLLNSRFQTYLTHPLGKTILKILQKIFEKPLTC